MNSSTEVSIEFRNFSKLQVLVSSKSTKILISTHTVGNIMLGKYSLQRTGALDYEKLYVTDLRSISRILP